MKLNVFCFYASLLFVILGVLCGLSIVWLPDSAEVAFKGLISVAILLGGSSITALINHQYTEAAKLNKPDGGSN